MKCQSVACLWSASPPQHQVTSAAVLADPPTLYTGGSDGSIIWWNLCRDGDKHEARPVAMLCGHASAIADLTCCSMSSGGDALFSVCNDGVLCVWSRGTGQCKRRRKLPPWAGTPSRVSLLPSSRQHVCVASVCADSPATHGPSSTEGKSEAAADNKSSKFAILIVDSCALSIVQTVYHGFLPLGPLKCMTAIPSHGDGGREVIVLSDTIGKVQVLSMAKESDQEGDIGGISSNNILSIPGECSNEGGGTVLVAVNEKLLALVSGTHCMFKSVTTGSVVADISLENSLLCSAEGCAKSQLAGCMFLPNDKEGICHDGQDSNAGIGAHNFVLWSTKGAAVVYVMRGDAEMQFEPLYEIPAFSRPENCQTSVIFCKLKSQLLRVESICSAVGNLAIWRPHISIWSILELHLEDNQELGKLMEAKTGRISGNPPLGTMVGQGDFSVDWMRRRSSSTKQVRHMKCLNDINEEFEKSDSEILSAGSTSNRVLDCNNHHSPTEQVVSSSMVLSENFYAPYAVVYGFHSGDIEVIRFRNLSIDRNSSGESIPHCNSSHISKQLFLGHTDKVICLAAHYMVTKSNEHSSCHVLISGSSDCTVRVWDLETGNPIKVLHHHLAPVRQIILPPPSTDRPWNDCFLSVGEDCCVALVSLETLKVERMFPGHSFYPSMVVWDSTKGYVACLCRNFASLSDAVSALYLWDVKTGARERVLRGMASYSMFDHFCKRINVNAITGNILAGTTSASLLHIPTIEDTSLSTFNSASLHKQKNTVTTVGEHQRRSTNIADLSYDTAGNGPPGQASWQSIHQNKIPPIKCSCPFPGIAALKFDLTSVMYLYETNKDPISINDKQVDTIKVDNQGRKLDYQLETAIDACNVLGTDDHQTKELVEGYLIRFSLAFLHLWDIDLALDKLLMDEMNIFRPEGLFVASGIPGDRGSLMLTFPGVDSNLELWKSSSEFCAMRSLIIVSLAQRLITLSHSCSAASSALAAFYTRNFAEKVPDIKPPLLQLLVSFWQHPSEHVRMAARSLFHCAAPRAVPHPICNHKTVQPGSPSNLVHIPREYLYSTEDGNGSLDPDDNGQSVESAIAVWLESYEMHDWISCIGGTTQDAMASHIIVAGALAVWYPSIVKAKLAELVVHHLIKLVMAVNDRYSSTAAELLSEGMDSTWKACIAPEIPHLIGDIFFQIECLSGASSTTRQNPSLAINIQDSLVGILLPSLAMADIPAFLHVIESQIWATSSDSPVHLVSLTVLIRVIRGSPKPLATYLDKVVNYILQTMDYANSAMRKTCLQSSITALREVARVFPMVSLNEAFSRLAVGDAIGQIHDISIRVYDLQSLAKIKVLDASGPPGLPSVLSGASDTIVTGISAVSFSPDGEGLVAFSEHGLVIRWWSLGTAWWEKLSRSMVPVQCTKLIFVPPWEGLSPNSSRASIIASIAGHEDQTSSEENQKIRESSDADSLKALLHNLDLSYRLEWTGGRKVILIRHGHELGSFQF